MKKRITLGLVFIIAFSLFMPLDFDVAVAASANKKIKAYVCNDSAGCDYIYLISDKMESEFIGMEWDRKKFPKCPYSYATGEKNSMLVDGDIWCID